MELEDLNPKTNLHKQKKKKKEKEKIREMP